VTISTGIRGLQSPANRQAILAGQHQVEHHKVDATPAQQAIQFGSACTRPDGETFAHQQAGDQRPDFGVVLDDGDKGAFSQGASRTLPDLDAP
jgi:hypothetical protein